jgi:REP element-mobilizing transposase RayT
MQHVINRGVGQMDIFRSDADRSRFLCLVVEAFRRFGVSLFAYCLMPNHFHLLAAASDVPIETAMHWLETRYAQYFNWRYARSGHVFQDRFKGIPCRDDAYLFELIAYIHLNPVRKGLVDDPGAWPWSSHNEYLGGHPGIVDFASLEVLSGWSPRDMKERYREKVGCDPADLSLEEMVGLAAYFVGVRAGELGEGRWGRAFTRGRRMVLAWATRGGHSLDAVAAALNCSKSALSQLR